MKRQNSNDLYLVITDKNSKLCQGMPYRKGNVPSVWTQVISGWVRTFRDLIGRYSHFNVPFKTHLYSNITLCYYMALKNQMLCLYNFKIITKTSNLERTSSENCFLKTVKLSVLGGVFLHDCCSFSSPESSRSQFHMFPSL